MVCPKCSKVMLDVRAEKSSPKAPDFVCPDASCLNDKGYRTGAWLPKAKSPVQAPIARPEAPQPQSAPLVSPRDTLLIELYWDSFDRVLEGVAKRKLTDLFKPEHLCAAISTLYIQRARG